MNRLLFLLIALMPVFCFAQNYGICIQVVGSAGGSAEQSGYHVSWTIGEMAISTLRSPQHILTQGFHQPDVCAAVSTWNLDLEALGIEVFPNPAVAQATVRFTQNDALRLHLSAYDLLGRQVLSPLPLETPSGTPLDLSNWAPGVYFLQITDEISHTSAALRLICLQ